MDIEESAQLDYRSVPITQSQNVSLQILPASYSSGYIFQPSPSSISYYGMNALDYSDICSYTTNDYADNLLAVSDKVRPILSYSYLCYLFSFLAFFFGMLIILSAARLIIIKIPFFIFYGFLGSSCLAITNFVGLKSERRKNSFEHTHSRHSKET